MVQVKRIGGSSSKKIMKIKCVDEIIKLKNNHNIWPEYKGN